MLICVTMKRLWPTFYSLRFLLAYMSWRFF